MSKESGEDVGVSFCSCATWVCEDSVPVVSHPLPCAVFRKVHEMETGTGKDANDKMTRIFKVFFF